MSLLFKWNWKRKPENVANAIDKILQMRKFASVKGWKTAIWFGTSRGFFLKKQLSKPGYSPTHVSMPTTSSLPAMRYQKRYACWKKWSPTRKYDRRCSVFILTRLRTTYLSAPSNTTTRSPVAFSGTISEILEGLGTAALFWGSWLNEIACHRPGLSD